MSVGQTAQRVEVVAVDLQRDLRAHAGQQVVEAMADRLADAGSDRQAGQALPDVGNDLLAAAFRRLQVHVHLGVMHALGMFVELGAAGAAADLGHLGHLASPVAPPACRCGWIRPARCRD
jgi:hypothetical protein